MAVSSLPQVGSSKPFSMSGPLSQSSNDPKPIRTLKSYHQARPVPYELRQHTIAFLEEELCTVTRRPHLPPESSNVSKTPRQYLYYSTFLSLVSTTKSTNMNFSQLMSLSPKSLL